MAKKNAFLKISSSLFFSKEIAMYACINEMQTHFNKERKYIDSIYTLHITNKLFKRYLHPYMFRTRIKWRVSLPRIVGLVSFINRG